MTHDVPPALVAASIAIAVGCSVAFGSPGNIAFWPDSVSYFAAAESLRHGALLTHEGQLLTMFPPAYPAVVALASTVGVGRPMAAFLVNAIAVLAIAIVLCRTVWFHTRSRGATVAIVLACLALGAVPGRLRYAGSELPFMAFTLVALDWTARRVWRRGARPAFVLGLVCCAAFLTRYSGLVVIAVVGLWLVADVWRQQPRRYSAITWFAAGVAPLSAAWLLRNYAADGALMGRRSSSVASLPETVSGIVSTMVAWALPNVWWANRPVEWLVVGIVVFAILGLAVVSARRSAPDTARTVTLNVVFGLVYIAFVAISVFQAAIDIIEDRLLAPAFIPFALAIGIAAATAVNARIGHAPKRRATTWLWAAATVMILALTVVQEQRRRAPSINYLSAEWEKSATTRAATAIDRSARCYSNASPPLYLWTGLRCKRALTKSYRTADRRPDPLLEHLQQNGGGTVYYVWYRRHNPEGLIGNPDVLLEKHVRHRVQTADGEVLELGPPASH
jgi:hypothetical protein